MTDCIFIYCSNDSSSNDTFIFFHFVFKCCFYLYLEVTLSIFFALDLTPVSMSYCAGIVRPPCSLHVLSKRCCILLVLLFWVFESLFSNKKTKSRGKPNMHYFLTAWVFITTSIWKNQMFFSKIFSPHSLRSHESQAAGCLVRLPWEPAVWKVRHPRESKLAEKQMGWLTICFPGFHQKLGWNQDISSKHYLPLDNFFLSAPIQKISPAGRRVDAASCNQLWNNEHKRCGYLALSHSSYLNIEARKDLMVIYLNPKDSKHTKTYWEKLLL